VLKKKAHMVRAVHSLSLYSNISSNWDV